MEEKLTDLGLCYPNCVQINWTQRTQQANTAPTSSSWWSWSVAVPRCAADQTLCLLNLKRLPAQSPMGAKNVCGGEKEKRKVFFFFFVPFTVFFLPFVHSGSAWASGVLGSSDCPGSLLIQDNKCLSLGFRQLFTLSWRLRRGPGTLSDVLLFSRTFQFVPVTRPCSPFSLSTLGFVQVPAAFCIISALGFKVSAVALALICHLEVIFIYSRAKSSGNFMMTFRFQGFSQAFAI